MSTLRTILVLTGLLVASSLWAQSAERRFTGVDLRVRPFLESEEVRGELVAVTGDTVWLAGAGDVGPTPILFDRIESARARTHEFGSRKTLIMATIGWAATSFGLLVACGQVEGASCGFIPFAMALPWGLVGGIAAATNEARTWQDFAERLSELGAYARFPQGLPAEMRP